MTRSKRSPAPKPRNSLAPPESEWFGAENPEPPAACPPVPFACSSDPWSKKWFTLLVWPLILLAAPALLIVRLVGLALGVPLLCLGSFLINIGSDQTQPISPLREGLWTLHYYLVCGYLGLVQGMFFLQRNRRLKYHPRAPIAIVNHTSNNDSLAMAHCNPGTPVTKAGVMNNWFFRQIFAASRVLLVGRPPSDKVRRWFVGALRDYEEHAGEEGYTPFFPIGQLDMVRWIVAEWGDAGVSRGRHGAAGADGDGVSVSSGAGAASAAGVSAASAAATAMSAAMSPFSAFVQSGKTVGAALQSLSLDDLSTISKRTGTMGGMELVEAVTDLVEHGGSEASPGEQQGEPSASSPGGTAGGEALKGEGDSGIDYALLRSTIVRAQAMVFLEVERNRRIYTPHGVSEAMRERAEVYMQASQQGLPRGTPKWRQTVIFAEGTITDQSCLCRFRTGAFRLDVPVQPITVRYHTVLPQEWLMNGLIHNLACLLLNPFALVTVTYHEPMERREDESYRQFADRVGRFMAEKLGATYCPYNNDDYLYFNGVKPAEVCTPEWRRDFGWMGTWKEFSRRLGLRPSKGLSRAVLEREYGKWYVSRKGVGSEEVAATAVTDSAKETKKTREAKKGGKANNQ